MLPRSLLFACLLAGASAFVPTGVAPVRVLVPAAGAPSLASSPAMSSVMKKAKAAKRKGKSSSAVAKRFKVTATGKLLRHSAFKSHILTKKHPLRKQKLRRTLQADESQAHVPAPRPPPGRCRSPACGRDSRLPHVPSPAP